MSYIFCHHFSCIFWTSRSTCTTISKKKIKAACNNLKNLCKKNDVCTLVSFDIVMLNFKMPSGKLFTNFLCGLNCCNRSWWPIRPFRHCHHACLVWYLCLCLSWILWKSMVWWPELQDSSEWERVRLMSLFVPWNWNLHWTNDKSMLIRFDQSNKQSTPNRYYSAIIDVPSCQIESLCPISLLTIQSDASDDWSGPNCVNLSLLCSSRTETSTGGHSCQLLDVTCWNFGIFGIISSAAAMVNTIQ